MRAVDAALRQGQISTPGQAAAQQAAPLPNLSYRADSLVQRRGGEAFRWALHDEAEGD